VVVYGTGPKELTLLTSKIAAREGIDTSCICDESQALRYRRLMYGDEYAQAGVDVDGNAKPVTEGEDIGAALKKAKCLILACYESSVTEETVRTFLKYTGDDFNKIVLMSKIGVTKAKPSLFGIGGGDAKMLEQETFLRKIAQEKNADLSIVRAGTVKGGGPGKGDWGLDRSFYNTILDLLESRITEYYDEFTLGAECSLGDTIDPPNPVSQFSSKSTFEPRKEEVSRTVFAAATVAASLYDKPIDFTVSSAKATELPTTEEWNSLLDGLN